MRSTKQPPHLTINRMSRLLVLLSLFFTVQAFDGSIALGDPAATIQNTANPAALNKWSDKMQELYKTLSELLTDVTSDRRFRDPANRLQIENLAKKLANAAHSLNSKEMSSPDADPSVKIIAEMLGRETKRAVSELKSGNYSYARSILRSVPSYCIACHTRTSSGARFDKLPLEPSSDSLTSLEKGQFFAASRQFDRAQTEFRKIIMDPKSLSENTWDWETAINQSLAIAVRVKKDPKEAMDIVQTILNAKTTPTFMKDNAKAWKTSINEWAAEPLRKISTEVELHNEAMRLMQKARESQKYPMDRTADVVYLRASATVHDLLQVAPSGKVTQDALFLAGLSYEVLSPLKLEDLHEVYYEACIKQTPHTPTAELCYSHYEEAMFFEYTGSAGTDVPEDVKQRLQALRQLAQPETTIKN